MILVAQHLERQPQPLRHLALIACVLHTETEHIRADGLECAALVAKATCLRRATPRAGYLISACWGILIHEIDRFPTVQDFASYARLVKCAKESAGKRHGASGAKIGNAHLKWVFSEASVLFLRANPQVQRYLDQLTAKHGKAKALSILAHKLGRAVYYLLKRQEAFDSKRFFSS